MKAGWEKSLPPVSTSSLSLVIGAAVSLFCAARYFSFSFPLPAEYLHEVSNVWTAAAVWNDRTLRSHPFCNGNTITLPIFMLQIHWNWLFITGYFLGGELKCIENNWVTVLVEEKYVSSDPCGAVRCVGGVGAYILGPDGFASLVPSLPLSHHRFR